MSGQVKIPYRAWSGETVGLLENRVTPGVGYEIPSEFAAWGEKQGELAGAARLSSDLALDEGCGVYSFVDGGVGVRKLLGAEAAAIASIPVRKLVASEEARQRLVAVRVHAAKDELPLLVGKEDDAKAKATETTERLEKVRSERDHLSFSERGLIGSEWVLIGIEASAVAFDAAVLHSALEFSGMGSVSVWMTSLLAPAALGAIHFTFGTVLGGILRKLSGSQRLKAAIGGLAAGLVALMTTFLLLAVFREAGNDALNAGLTEIASGDSSGDLNLFISSLWLAPLQLAASASAITAAALWVIGKPGREHDQEVSQATVEHVKAKQDLDKATSAVGQTRQVVRDGQPEIHQISVDAREAEAQNEAEKDALELRLGAEDALGHAVKGKYKAAFQATSQIYDNGRVVRAAVGDEERLGRKARRHPARDVSERAPANDNNTSSDSNGNGYERAGGRGFRRWFS